MASEVVNERLAVALSGLDAAVDAVLAVGVDPVDGVDAVAVLRRLERVLRRVEAAEVTVIGQVDQRGLHRGDGHASAKVLARHACRLSDPQAARLARASRALRPLTLVADGYRAGRYGAAYVDRLARLYANPRVRTAMIESETMFVQWASMLAYREFDARVNDWERRIDEDGSCDRSQRHHDNRDLQHLQDYDGSWRFTGGCGSIQGAEINSILSAFEQGEFHADWADARERLGDAATTTDLPRTPAQRRFDAFHRAMRAAANARAAAPGGSVIETVIVIDHTTFERTLHRMAGHTPDPIDPNPDPDQPTGYRCDTLDGHIIDPTEATANALTNHIRRAVLGADSVVIDLGRRIRLFTGPAQLAARLTSTACVWTSCHIPVTHCQTDHLEPWHPPNNGTTDPTNAAPLCGRHNRHKEHGFTIERDTTGTFHVYRPDGTPLDEPHPDP